MSEEEYNNIVTFIAQSKHVDSLHELKDDIAFVWHAGDDTEEEGVFQNWYTNQHMPYLPWAVGMPTSSPTQHNILSVLVFNISNVSNIEVKSAEIVEIGETDEPSYPVCSLTKKSLTLKLRGLCSDFSFDHEYVYTISEEGQELYQGKTSSVIHYNRTGKLWQISKPKDNTSIITSTSPWKSYLLGLHQVNFLLAKDEECYKEDVLQKIKLTSCRSGSFTCNNGACISMNKRCDQTPHCKDKSDEEDCKLIIMENYNTNIAPYTVNTENDEVEAVKVNISVKVIEILNINEVQQSFQLKFSLFLTWYDYRLVYHNLKASRIANSPSKEEVAKLWMPKIIFDNTEHNDIMTLDDLAEVTISKEGSTLMSDDTVVDEIEIFKGSENKITFDKGFTKTVRCIYQLQLYPFDTQQCTVNLRIGEYKTKFIELFPKSIKLKSETLLTQFLITDFSLEYKYKGKEV